MDVIELFVVLSTVVLLCSWGFIIYSNWEGSNKMIRFPPYGYDSCPIGYYLNHLGTQCEPKAQLTHIGHTRLPTIDVNPAANTTLNKTKVCNLFKEYNDELTAWDGLPTKATYKNPQLSKAYTILNNCCTDLGNTCSSLDFSRIIGSENDDLK